MFNRPACKISKSMRKPIYGHGVNDLDYIILEKLSNGKYKHCPYYQRWKNMLERCFSNHYKYKYPTYKDVTCCDEWLVASNFIAWMKSKNWQGMHLDKDILVEGNKVYSPESCLFIPQELNKLLNFNKAQRGRYGIGISEFKAGKYRASIRNGSQNITLGRFTSIEDAQSVYLKAKKSLIIQAANDYSYLHHNIEERLIDIANRLSLRDL